jgi:hypothetical protein
MGTNYYFFDEKPCPTCGREDEPLHIGKSSMGWCFGLHVIPERGLSTLEEWQKLWNKPDSVIKDEYGREISPDDMFCRIAQRGDAKFDGDWKGFDFVDNHAEPGPMGLVRRCVGRHCVGHGNGTWDYVPGEFS